jgi:hypothetical protein
VPILVADEQGTFFIRELSMDGSLVAYRPDGQGGGRNFRPEWCCPAVRQEKEAKSIWVR